MRSSLVAGLCLLGVSAQAHTIVDGKGVGAAVPLCTDCGVVKFSGGAHHSDAVRMTIGVGSGAERGVTDPSYLYVAFKLDSFAPGAADTICTFQLERGPSHASLDIPDRQVTDNWPFGTQTQGYYDQELKAYVAQILNPATFRVGSVLGLTAACPKRDK